MLLTGLAAVGAIVGTVGILWLVARQRTSAEQVTLPLALAALDQSQFARARAIAEKLDRQGTLSIEECGGPAFVRGMAAANDAENALESEKPKHYAAVAKYLAEAHQRGFPAGREAEGLYLLGKSLYLTGQVAASRPILQSALKANTDKATEVHHLLALALARDVHRNLPKALEENQRYLADANLAAESREEGLLERADILFQLNRVDQCAALLAKLPARAGLRAEAEVLQGRILCREAERLRDRAAARRKYQAAMDVFRAARAHDNVNNRAVGPALYLTGLCLVAVGDEPAALAHFAQIGKSLVGTPEGLAAAYREAELARRLHRDAQALDAYRRWLSSLGPIEYFNNPWVSLEQLRTSVLAGYQDYLATLNFPRGLQLARLAGTLLPTARTTELAADAYRLWGEHLAGQAEGLPPAKAEATRRQARGYFRRAGGGYASLAQLQVVSRQYPEYLWQSAAAYSDGQDYVNAVRILRKYLSNESRQRYAQALVKLGEARLALGRWDEALDVLRQCIEEHPRDSVVYRARLLASKASAEKGALRRAEALLCENLNGAYLTPASKEWRESLFALATLLHDQRRDVEAIRRLEELLERYPDAPQKMEARYLLADAAWHRAGTLAATRRNDQARNDLLRKARDQYQGVQTVLAARDPRDLQPAEKALLRNCCFALGEVLCAMGLYDQALETYAAVASRYGQSPEVLDAYVRMAAIYRRLGKTAEARSSLQQAKLALARLKGDAPFDQTTNYSRSQWGELLDRLTSL
jgi:TolA-binding protein